MERILIVGGSGLTGSRLIGHLADRARIIAVSRSRPKDAPKDIEWRSVDLAAPNLIAALPERIDAIYALAQSSAFRCFPDQALAVFNVNTAATAQLLDYARRAGARLFVYASTGGLYAPATTPIAEDHPLRIEGPIGFYLASKRASELLVDSYRAHFTTVIVRPFFIYGPGQDPTMLLPRLLAAVRDGRPIPLAGHAGLSINPIHVEDAARLLANAQTLCQHALLNLAGGEAASLRSICERLGQILGRAPVFEVDGNTVSPSMVADVSRLAEVLGAAEIDLATGLATLARAQC